MNFNASWVEQKAYGPNYGSKQQKGLYNVMQIVNPKQ